VKNTAALFCCRGTGSNVPNNGRTPFLFLNLSSACIRERGGGGGERLSQGVTKKRQPMSTAVHRSPNKLCRSDSIFNLWVEQSNDNIKDVVFFTHSYPVGYQSFKKFMSMLRLQLE
jgi:hypothetical protein